MRAGAFVLLPIAAFLFAAASPPMPALGHESPASLPDVAPHESVVAGGGDGLVANVTGEPAMLAALRAKGAKIMALGERGGLDGHFVELADGDAYSLYVTPDGHAVVGLLYAPDGMLVTGRQIAAARGLGDGVGAFDAETLRNNPGSDAAAGDDPILLAHGYQDRAEARDAEVPGAEALFERSASAFGFTLGRTGPAVVVFADPACRWSRSAAARLGQAALDGRLRLRVVPVAVLGAASAQEAAAIASAADPALAWFGGATGPAGMEGGRRIARNNALYDRWGVDAVPLIAWRARDGRIAHRLGDIDDLGAWLGALPHE